VVEGRFVSSLLSSWFLVRGSWLPFGSGSVRRYLRSLRSLVSRRGSQLRFAALAPSRRANEIRMVI
jgi:hypothetical protein